MRPPDKKWFQSLRWGIFSYGRSWCAAAWTPRGLSALILPQNEKSIALRKLQDYLPPAPATCWESKPNKVPSKIQTETRKALSGKSFQFSRFDLSFLTPFQRNVLSATGKIPWGQYRTYGWVALKAGSPRGFRAAGQALNRNTIPLFIPCHRVIAGGNRLGGYGGGLDWKIKLLKNEGVRVNQGVVR